MNKHDFIKSTIDTLKMKCESSSQKAWKYDLTWKVCQGFITLIGILTPLIVVYRKDSFLPQQFWVAWCIATPLITAVVSFLLSYFDWQGLASEYSKHASLTSNLIERAENKLAFASEESYEIFQEWLYEEKQKIEAII